MQGRPAFICGGAGVVDLGFRALNFAIYFVPPAALRLQRSGPLRLRSDVRARPGVSGGTVTLTEVLERRKFSVLSGALVLAACAPTPPAKPPVPESISPGWKLMSLARAPRPAEVAADGNPTCWKGTYTGAGTAEVSICWYKVAGNAFDAAQRTRAEAQAVKFGQGNYFVLVKWNHAPRTELMALVRALEKALPAAQK